MSDFCGKNVVITGANRGIGLACVNAFAEEGANIIAVVRSPELFLEKAKDIEKKYHTTVSLIEAEFCEEDSVKKAGKEILSMKKNIDILINNAGVSYPNSVFNMTSMEQIKKAFEINFFSPMFFTQILAKSMIRNKQGCIIFLSSSAAFDGGNNIEYSASKAAIIGAVRRLAIEYGQYGIRVNAVAPGFTDTDMGNAQNEELYKLAMEKNIIKRMADPSEIAGTIKFLASKDAGYITGQILKITGGIG